MVYKGAVVEPTTGLEPRSLMVLGPSAGRRISPAQTRLQSGHAALGTLASVATPMQVKEAVEQRSRALGEEKMASAWGLEFEADALAAQGETRFLQAEIHRLLAERASEQVATGRSVADLEATISWLQAERENDRALMRDARENVEAATSELSEGYEMRVHQLEADRSALKEQVHQLETEIQSLHVHHLQDIQAHRCWHSSALDSMLETQDLCASSEAARLALRAWHQLLRGQDAHLQRRRRAARVLGRQTQESDIQAKRALLAAWHSAVQRRAERRRGAAAVTEVLERSSELATTRRAVFIVWRLTVHPLRGSARKALTSARCGSAAQRGREALRSLRRSCWDTWAVNAREAARSRTAEATIDVLRTQVATETAAAQAKEASAEKRLHQVEMHYQESEMIAAEASSQQLIEQKLECAKLESRLSTASEREEELRVEVSRLADLLTAAEAEALQMASDVADTKERLAAKAAEAQALEEAELSQHKQEAAVAGRCARLVQQVVDQDEEIEALRASLKAERAALTVLRRSEFPLADSVTSTKSLPTRIARVDVDEAKNRWRLEHSHSVSAIQKSGILPETLPSASGRRRLIGSQ